MNEDLHNIDDLFKSRIEGKEEAPSPAVWENIEKELNKKDSRPKIFVWWNSRRIITAALILVGSAGLFGGGYYFGVHRENQIEAREKKRISSPVADFLEKHKSFNKQPVSKEKFELQLPIEKETATTPVQTKPVGVEVGNIKAGAKVALQDQNNLTSSRKSALGEGKIIYSSALKSQPAGGSKFKKEDSFVNGKTEPIQKDASISNFSIPRTGGPETVSQSSWSTALPEIQKHIAVSKVSPALSPEISQATAAKSIPVLNKRSSAVDLPRFSLTPVAGLQFGSNRIVASDDPHANNVKIDIDGTESQPMSISGGILADLRIARNMTLQSGIVLTSRTIEIEPKYIKAERNPDGKVRYKLDCSAGTYFIKKSTYARPGDSALTIFSTNELNYINIPLALTYHFGGRKFSFFATAGAGLNLLTDQYLETGLSNYNYDEHESIATNLKSRYYNGMVGAGILYRPFKKISFLFTPQYQFAISPMNENMPVKAYPRIFNIQAGMQIRL